MRIVIDLSDNSIVQPNQFIKSGDNEWARFTYASRTTIPGKSGKVCVNWTDGNYSGEYYANVFNLCVIDTDSITHWNEELVDHWEKLGVNIGSLIASPEYQNFLQLN